MTFVADCMLGRLAKWLRILGFDVAYFSRAEDRDLAALARREGRVLLTRDTGLIERTAKRPNRLFVRSDDWEDQVVQVLDEFGLWDAVRPNTRCIACNLPLRPLSRERARNLVTPFVTEHAASFAICPGCQRVFWQGTHYGDMERKIAKLRGRRG
ncbi:MAG: Mut7-C RNAse domain-containing protein [Acidobacteriota bacterium]